MVADILKHTKETIPFLHALLVFSFVLIVSMNKSFETHSLCIQFWLTAVSANDVMVATFLKSIKPDHSQYLFIRLLLLFVDNDNMMNRILGPCLCTLQYIRLVFKRYTWPVRASPCIPLSNLPNILKCTKTGTYICPKKEKKQHLNESSVNYSIPYTFQD